MPALRYLVSWNPSICAESSILICGAKVLLIEKAPPKPRPCEKSRIYCFACGAGPRGTSPLACAGVFFFLSAIRVLSPVVVAVFFFLEVSPDKPNGLACAWRSATSAACGAEGAWVSATGPLALSCFASLARSLKRVFFVGAVASRGFTGSTPELAVCGPPPPPASSVLACGALGRVLVGAWPRRIFSFFPGFIDACSTVAPFLPFFAGFAVAGAGAGAGSAGAEAEAVFDCFCRKLCVLSRKRVRSTFFFFFGVGGA